MSDEGNGARSANGWANWLLLIPFIVLLWVPFYNRAEPSFMGFPFFYWFQLLWIVLGAVVTGFVYLLTRNR
ncbi:MAG TPA: DUF3311 domain-containing protein [Stellaceae bacterium]|nr:DUF3311 domain-containing protein [Stellaceae bacterium]